MRKNRYLTCHSKDGGGSEFEGLKGGFRMMSLLTLFGGLKNVFRVKSYTTDTVIFRLHYKVTISSHLQSSSELQTPLQGDDRAAAGLQSPGDGGAAGHRPHHLRRQGDCRSGEDDLTAPVPRVCRASRAGSSTRTAGPTPPSRCPAPPSPSSPGSAPWTRGRRSRWRYLPVDM